MNKLKFIICLIICAGCSNNPCKIDSFERVRKNEQSMNKDAKKHLNEISQILDGRHDMINTSNSKNQARIRVTEIFFSLNETDDVLHFETCYYLDELKLQLSHCFTQDLPLEKINSENIEFSEFNGGIFGETGIISFTAVNSDPNSFQIKAIDYKQNEPKVTQCETWDNFSIDLNLKDAKTFYKEIVGFVKNYHEN